MSSAGIAIVGNQLWMGKRHDGASGTWIHSGSASAVGRGDSTAPKTSSEFQSTEGPSGIQGILERLCFHDRGPGDPSEMRAIRIRIDRGSWNRYLPRRNSSSHRSVVLGHLKTKVKPLANLSFQLEELESVQGMERG